MHLVGFIIRIYHDAWPHERQTCTGSVRYRGTAGRRADDDLVTTLTIPPVLQCSLLFIPVLKRFCTYRTESESTQLFSLICKISFDGNTYECKCLNYNYRILG